MVRWKCSSLPFFLILKISSFLFLPLLTFFQCGMALERSWLVAHATYPTTFRCAGNSRETCTRVGLLGLCFKRPRRATPTTARRRSGRAPKRITTACSASSSCTVPPASHSRRTGRATRRLSLNLAAHNDQPTRTAVKPQDKKRE